MPTITANVFRGDAFSGLTLTEQVNRVPFMPTTLGNLGLFDDVVPIMTTAIQINREDGLLSLVPTSPRGAPGKQRVTEKRQARFFECPRLFEEDTIYASELQNVISEQDETQTLKDLSSEVAKRLTGPTGIVNQIAYTYEYHRLGAVQGVLLDADGHSVIYNWYTEFGITPPVEIGFDLLNNAFAGAGYMRSALAGVRRQMMRAGRGAFIDGVTEIHVLCGDLFFDQFVANTDVLQTYLNWSGAADLRENRAFTVFPFAGIYWHNYRGSDDNTTIAIAPDKCVFFPVKAPGVFQLALAPGEGFGSMNQLGKKLYVYRDLDPSEEQAWVKLKVKSYPLHICRRPEMLIRGRAGQ